MSLQLDETKKLLEAERTKLKNSLEQNSKDKAAWEKVTEELSSLVKQANKERDEISKKNTEHMEQSKEHLEKLKIRETELELLKSEYDRRLAEILSKSKADEFEKLKTQYDTLKMESEGVQKLLDEERRKLKLYESVGTFI